MGKFFNFIKTLLLIAILGYGAYWGWHYFGGDAELGRGGKTYTVSTETEGKDDDDDEGSRWDLKSKLNNEPESEELTPIEMQHQALDKISRQVFAPLSAKQIKVEGQLKNLWNLADTDFKGGNLLESDAKLLAKLITDLNKMANERNLFADRYKGLDDLKAGSFSHGMSAKERREFAEKDLQRLWKDWVIQNKNNLKPLFSGLSG